MSNLRTSIILDLAGNLESRSRRMASALSNMSSRAGRSLSRLSGAASAAGRGLDSLANRYTAALAGAGVAYKTTRAVMDSAALDKQLIRITQTAGATREAAGALRKELHLMSQQTGQSLDDLLAGFNNLVQSGLSWDAAFATIQAVNEAMAVTGSNADVLSSGLTVAAEAFGFDLTQVETAKLLLDQMTVAGRQGNAELEDLSGIFARVGVNAKSANLSFTDTLGFIEQLSLIERSPERLATLADSTLRLFTNQKYLSKAAQATGVSFYDQKGERRGAFDVLEDIAAKYKTLGTSLQKDRFIDAAFGDADLDTKKGLATLLGGESLAQVRVMSREIERAGGAIARDLPEAINNSVDQVARLRAALRDAADDFSRPVNDTIQEAIKFLLDERKLGGKEILAGGAAAGVLGFAAVKGGGKLLSRAGGLGGGLAMGKAMEEFGGVTPVYVVNMPKEGGFGGGGGPGGGGGGSRNPRSPKGGRLSRLAGRLGRYGRGMGRMAGLAGIGLTAYDLYDTWSDDQIPKERKIEQTGGALGGLGGAAAGAALGSMILPVIGTALGGMAGYFAGEWLGSKTAEALTPEAIGREVAKAVNAKEARISVDLPWNAQLREMRTSGMELDVVNSGPILAEAGGGR